MYPCSLVSLYVWQVKIDKVDPNFLYNLFSQSTLFEECIDIQIDLFQLCLLLYHALSQLHRFLQSFSTHKLSYIWCFLVGSLVASGVA